MKRGYGVSWFICWALVGHVGTMLGLSGLILGNLGDAHGSIKARQEPGITQQEPNMALRRPNFFALKMIDFLVRRKGQKIALLLPNDAS